MQSVQGIGLKDVQAVYAGAEGELWELVMGEQIHIGGFASSMALADKAGIGSGMTGVDLCCCTGGGMRFLTKFRGVERMTGVDATPRMIEKGRPRCIRDGVADRIAYVLADVCATGLPAGQADFVWGEDAWCYVADKPQLVREAARLVRPGGMIAFTDWLEGDNGLTAAEATRFLKFMKFPNLAGLEDYRKWLGEAGCEVVVAEDTRQFGPHVDLYLDMLNKQLTYDALRIIGFNLELLGAMGQEMVFMQQLAHAGKIIQGRVIARKR